MSEATMQQVLVCASSAGMTFDDFQTALAAHDKEVLDKAAERAAECIADLVFANSTDDAVVTVFTDYGPDVVAAVRGDGAE